MADRVLLVSWGEPVRGREDRTLEVFNESMGFWGRAQQEGRIESFDVCLFVPNAVMDGFLRINGSADQLHAIKQDEGYQRLMIDTSLIVEHMHVAEGWANEGVARQMQLYAEAAAKVPQTV